MDDRRRIREATCRPPHEGCHGIPPQRLIRGFAALSVWALLSNGPCAPWPEPGPGRLGPGGCPAGQSVTGAGLPAAVSRAVQERAADFCGSKVAAVLLPTQCCLRAGRSAANAAGGNRWLVDRRDGRR